MTTETRSAGEGGQNESKNDCRHKDAVSGSLLQDHITSYNPLLPDSQSQALGAAQRLSAEPGAGSQEAAAGPRVSSKKIFSNFRDGRAHSGASHLLLPAHSEILYIC